MKSNMGAGTRYATGVFTCIIVSLVGVLGFAATPSNDRPKIGLALSGGGARGAAHVGVLKVLEELHIPVEYIAGTSMGACVGGLYASGMSPDDIEEAIAQVDWLDAFDDNIHRRDRSFRRKRDDELYLIKARPGVSLGKIKFPAGIIQGQKVDLLLKRYTLPVVTIRDFDDLSIPYRPIAADLVSDDPVVLDQGDLALAIRASMSIPVVFAPREIDGRLLVDGGINKNLPIDVVRQMGADIVIAVDISSPLHDRDELQSMPMITNQLLNILARRDTDRQIAGLTDRDVFIKPDLGDIKTASFDRTNEAIPAGVAAAEAVLDKLKQFSVPEEEYHRYLADRAAQRRSAPVIDSVRVNNESTVADAVIAERLKVKTGQPLDVGRLEDQLSRVYGLEIFESVYYDVTSETQGTVLTVGARERSWGPHYLQFGIAISGDFEGTNRFNVAVAHDWMPINRLNGEWRTGVQIGQEPGAFTELYQPVSYRQRYFVHPSAWMSNQTVPLFDVHGNKLSEFRRLRYGAELAAGRELGTWGELRAGILREAGESKVRVGDPTFPENAFDTGELFVQLYVDELDNLNFPRSGGSLRLRAIGGLESLGSDGDYEQASVRGSYAHTLGRYTGLFGARLESTPESDAPGQSLFTLGGFTQLSGLVYNELAGQHSALISAMFYRRMGDSDLFPLYLGLSVEYGNVFQDRSAIKFSDGILAGSIFAGLDTFIGPFYVAYGRAEEGTQNTYVFLGQQPTRDRRSGFRNQ